MTDDELRKILSPEEIHINNIMYRHKESVERQEKWNQLWERFCDIVCVYDREEEHEGNGTKLLFKQKITLQDYARIIYNAFNSMVLYKANNKTPLVSANGPLCDDFLNKVYLPLCDNNSANNDWCTSLYNSFIVDIRDHNLYFVGQLPEPYQTTQDNRILVDNSVIDIVNRILFYNDRTAEINKANLSILNNKRNDWYRDRFSSFVDVLKTIREMIIAELPPKSDDYKYCSIVINGLYYIFEIDGKQAKLLGEKGNLLSSDYRFEKLSYSNNPWCLRMFIIPPIDELKPDMNTVLPFLRYLTMGSKDTFDKLALDFVHCVMSQGFKRRNTMVYGDLDKFDKWDKLIEKMASLIIFSDENYDTINPQLNNYQVHNCMLLDRRTPWNIVEQLKDGKEYCPDKKAYIPFNTNPFTHFYYVCQTGEDPKEMDKGNKYIHLEFVHGGEYFKLPQLGNHDLIWLAQLFFAHGWHLINKAAQSHRVKTRNIEKEFIENFLCKDGTYVVDGSECMNQEDEPHHIRLPLALIYALYKAYASKEKQTKPLSDSELRKMLEETYSFSYSTQKATKIDIDYISKELQPIMKKLGITFEENWVNSGNKKILNCTVKEEFWRALAASPETADDSNTDYDSFDKYIKEVYSRYQHMFIYNTAFIQKQEPEPYVSGSRLL